MPCCEAVKTPDKLRKEAERKRMKERGLRRLEVYVHPEDAPKVRAYVERLAKKRS